MKKAFTCLFVVLTALQVSSAELGMSAPALNVAEWVKGQAVNLNEGKGKNIYVVEFWATWCPPCRASIPHLTELQKKFKDKGVIVIGVSDETVAIVKPLVSKMGAKMEYTVAVDKNDKTSAAYMGTFGVGGIPHAFVVDKAGAIVWHGHPMDGLDKAIEAVLAGKKPAKS